MQRLLWSNLFCFKIKVTVLVAQLCPIFCDPVDCSPPDSYVHGTLQARILKWVAVQFSRGSSWPKDQTWVSCIAGRFFTIWATREALILLINRSLKTLKFYNNEWHYMQRNVLISQVKINTLLSWEESISSIVLVVALLFNNLCTSSLFKNNIQIINTQIT